eukprot:3762-Heterococcus_DN1.PRE.3
MSNSCNAKQSELTTQAAASHRDAGTRSDSHAKGQRDKCSLHDSLGFERAEEVVLVAQKMRKQRLCCVSIYRKQSLWALVEHHMSPSAREREQRSEITGSTKRANSKFKLKLALICETLVPCARARALVWLILCYRSCKSCCMQRVLKLAKLMTL